MRDLPTPTVTTTGLVREEAKDSRLDRDRFLPLTQEVANGFAMEINRLFVTPRAKAVLTSYPVMLRLAYIINEDPVFPFRARIEGGNLLLSPSLTKQVEGPALKSISDGVTSINKAFIRQTKVSEHFKYDLATLFQSAIHNAYVAAGLEEGAHSKYYWRGC